MARVPAIEVEELGVMRGEVAALQLVSFVVEPGQVVGLLGPSGCGKTTLMRVLVGVQQHVRGRCAVLGLPAGHPELRRRVGYVTQAPAVYPDLTITENLRYFSAVLGHDGGAVDRALDAVDLRSDARRLVRSLSGGQRSRVSLAVALLGRPEVLVLDEPTVGLDPVLRRSLWALFRSIAAAGTTLVVSSHVMDEATACDRLLLLREGRLVADTTEDELLRRTGTSAVEDAFVALIEASR